MDATQTSAALLRVVSSLISHLDPTSGGKASTLQRALEELKEVQEDAAILWPPDIRTLLDDAISSLTSFASIFPSSSSSSYVEPEAPFASDPLPSKEAGPPPSPKTSSSPLASASSVEVPTAAPHPSCGEGMTSIDEPSSLALAIDGLRETTCFFERVPGCKAASFPPPISSINRLGVSIPLITLDRKLANGGTGVVWEDTTGVLVCKIVSGGTPEIARRMEEMKNEAVMNITLDRLACGAARPRYFGFFKSATAIVLVFERMYGRRFRTWEELKPFEEEALDLLDMLHLSGVEHGDFYPQNLLYERGKLVVIDFGRAEEVQQGGPELEEEMEAVRWSLKWPGEAALDDGFTRRSSESD